MTDWLSVDRGSAPLIVSMPHIGTWIPKEVADRLGSTALAVHDADFHIDRLYGFATSLGATVVRTSVSRTVIDVNRDPSGASLYPGQATTGLCPVETFDGEPLYRDGEAPGDAEIARRRAAYFDPYHAALATEIDRLRGLHPRIVLYDAHSIRSHVPRLFEGDWLLRSPVDITAPAAALIQRRYTLLSPADIDLGYAGHQPPKPKRM